MSLQIWRHSHRLVLWLIVLTVVSGCSGRRLMTAVEDQAFQPSPSPTSVGDAAKAVPPAGAEEPEMRVAEQPVALVPPAKPAPSSAELADVYFDFDRYAIRGDARSPLERNATLLKSQPNREIVIEGHCDERGTSAYNIILAERRAQAVKRYLQERGMTPSQIHITSYGKERPFCTEHNEACWQSNRRAHFMQP